jgi:peptide/nickel transport system substrate-binding protein
MSPPISDASLTRRGVLALGAAAAALGAGEARAAAASTLHVSFPVPTATLDPAKQRVGGLEYNYSTWVFSHLCKQDGQLQVLPDLAASWESTPDLKSWTFHLRPNVKWHDGKPLTADDVVFTFKRLQDASVASVLRANFSIVTGIVAVDPLTVRFDLSIPYGDLPATTAGYQAAILRADTIDTITTKPIGTGAWRFVEYRPGDQMVLEKNPDYFIPGLPKMDRAVLQIIPEYTTAVAALETGAIDIVYDLPPEQSDRLKKSTASNVVEIPSGTWMGVIMGNKDEPFTDPRIRRAVLKMIDKPTVTDIATFGHGTPTITPIPPFHPYYRHDISVTSDLPGAKKLLAEAGVKNLTLEMFVPGQNPSMERLATAFRDAAKDVGVKVDLRIIPQDKFFAEMEGKVPFNIDMFFARATPDLALYPWYHSTGSWNNTLWHYSNAEVDKLLEAARQTSDKAEQKKLYGRFQEIIAEDGPGSICFVVNFACGVGKKVSGFLSTPIMLMDISNVTVGA